MRHGTAAESVDVSDMMQNMCTAHTADEAKVPQEAPAHAAVQPQLPITCSRDEQRMPAVCDGQDNKAMQSRHQALASGSESSGRDGAGGVTAADMQRQSAGNVGESASAASAHILAVKSTHAQRDCSNGPLAATSRCGAADNTSSASSLCGSVAASNTVAAGADAPAEPNIAHTGNAFESVSAAVELARAQAQVEQAMQQRAAAAAAREAAALEHVATYARRTVAAKRIQRAWRAWQSSDIRTQRLGALARVQRALGAWVARRRGKHSAQVAAARAQVRYVVGPARSTKPAPVLVQATGPSPLVAQLSCFRL